MPAEYHFTPFEGFLLMFKLIIFPEILILLLSLGRLYCL